MNTVTKLRRPTVSRMETGLVAKPLEYDRSWQQQWKRSELEAVKYRLRADYSQFGGTANMVHYCLDTKRWRSRRNMACHAQMSYFSKKRVNEYQFLMGTENAARRTHTKRDRLETRPFFEWFITDSPFAEVILNRDDVDFCWDYGFVFSCLAPQPLVMGMLVVSRHFREVNIECFRLWSKLVGEGIHPWIAYEATMNSGLSMSPNTPLESEYSIYSGHRLHYAQDVKGLLKYFRGDAQPANLSRSMLEAKSIIGSSVMFSCPDNLYLTKTAERHREVRNAIEEHRTGNKVDRDMYRPPNPFNRQRHGFNENNYEKFSYAELSVVLPVIQELIAKELAKYA